MISYPTPESILRVERMNSHFTKYHLGNGRVLHHFTAAQDEDFHDHPWPFRTSILSGGYVEIVAEPCHDGTLALATLERLPGTSHEVQAGTIHKLTRLIGSDCWTLVEPGIKVRESGFYRSDDAGLWHRYWHESEWKLSLPALILQ